MILKMGVLVEACCGGMHLRMQYAESVTPARLQEFLDASAGIEFTGQSRSEVYAWVEKILVDQQYACQEKKQRGIIRQYLSKVSGLSLPQMTRLIRAYANTGKVVARRYRRHRFHRVYTAADVALLVGVDNAHERLSGPATRHILKREYDEFGKREFVRLAKISVGHLYNLRNSAAYRKQAAVWEPTRPSAVSIAERRRPDAQGRPGYLRVDTVHQGDWDGA